MTSRLVVLASGNGSNMEAIAGACVSGRIDAEIVAVVTNRPNAGAIPRAERLGLDVEVVPADGRTRAVYDGVLAHVVENHRPDLVILAGWMWLLTRSFLRRFGVINLHPALPGAFPGLDAIERSYSAWRVGEIEHGGVMVHWVPDEGVDDGPVIASRPVPFESGDTLEAYAERMHAAEHDLLIEAIDLALATTPDPAGPDPTGPDSAGPDPTDPDPTDRVNA